MQGTLSLEHANVRWARLAKEPVGPFDFHFHGALVTDLGEETFSLHQAAIAINRARLLLDASLDQKKAFQVDLRLADLDIQAAIDSCPRSCAHPPSAARSTAS